MSCPNRTWDRITVGMAGAVRTAVTGPYCETLGVRCPWADCEKLALEQFEAALDLHERGLSPPT